MPKISALPVITSPDSADELPIVDTSTSSTKKMTLTKLKEWLQSLVGGGNTDAIADASVTNAKLATAAGEPGAAWTSWTPTYGANGSMTYTSVTTDYAKYIQIGKTVHFQMSAFGTIGGTVDTRLTFTLPIDTLGTATFAALVVSPNVESGCGFISDSGTVADVVRAVGGNWVLGPNRLMRVAGSYGVA